MARRLTEAGHQHQQHVHQLPDAPVDHAGIRNGYGLDEMAEHYRDHECLSAFWLSLHPGYVLDFPYETLVQEPEAQIRRLLAFCELPFDAACLAPARSAQHGERDAGARADPRRYGHSAPYLEQLRPLRERLAR